MIEKSLKFLKVRKILEKLEVNYVIFERTLNQMSILPTKKLKFYLRFS